MNRIKKQLPVHNFYANILCSRILEFCSTRTVVEQHLNKYGMYVPH